MGRTDSRRFKRDGAPALEVVAPLRPPSTSKPLSMRLSLLIWAAMAAAAWGLTVLAIRHF